ncbi:thiol-disulfide oxidoreductase DCC family protein [Roseobacter sp.]|uniref:thiol-disulfide oxidoreductase DCC family protein n=1 Tax=Roseobacter sp. TaxID=1907202 RepID=UPI00385E1C6B
MEKIDVLYNADCPVCHREMDHYAKMSKAQELPLQFDDLNDPEALQTWDVSADMAAQRLHVRTSDQLLSGMPAFIVLWESLPRYRWVAKVVGLPGLYQIANWGYDHILAPLIYRRHQKRLAKQGFPAKKQSEA